MSTVAMEEYELMRDAKYRLYVSAVDKALKLFESTDEWQDLITALSKLNKVLKEHQRFPVIPRRIKISKRLAQCMHFTLPAGVHLKAIETYDTIFKCMGTGRLSHELFIYSAGLFPLLGHSAMAVKPPLLEVYENHFVPLGPRLRPGLSGFLSGVLPGLEEGSDHFDRTNALLEKVCEGVGSTFFYGSLWECVSCNSAIRLPAISFVLAHYNKKLKVEDQSYIMGTDTNVMVNGLCAGVQDSNVLVQRNSLELLMGIFPMHNNYLGKTDMISLVTAALTTIQRRDISLNRRLYAWLLGTDINASEFDAEHPMIKLMGELGEVPQSSLYFDMYSKENLIQGVRNILGNENMSYSDIRPYRLVMSLLDKSDVGPIIIDDLLYEIFRTLYLACKQVNDNTKQRQEILNSANLLFNTFEPGYIWQYAGCLFDQACKKNIEELTTISEIEYSSVIVKPVGSGIPNVWEICELYEFLLGVIPLDACGDSPREYLFHLLIHLIPQLTKYMESLSEDQIARTLKFCSTILAKIQSLTNSRKLSKSESISGDSLVKNFKLEHINPAIIRSRAGTDLNQRPPSEDNNSVSNDSLYMSLESEVQISAENQNLLLAFETLLKNYEIFYVTLVGSGRIIHSQMVPEVFDKMKRKIDYSDESEYASQLKRILTAVMNDDDTTELFYRRNRKSESVDCSSDVAVEGNEKWEESFKVASEILVQLSSFPRYYTEQRYNEAVFTPWMKILLVCACCLVKSPKLQLIAIRTFLILLTASQMDDKREMVGLFNSSHLHFLEHDTNVVEIIARTLWRHLGDLTSDLQVTCIELIYQLHSTFSFEDCVERVLGEALLKGTENGQIEALQRFTKLWHVGRDLQSKELKHKKLFHRCLLKLLDNMLLTENSSLKIETQTWLVQSLMRGDIARLLDPILTMLLDPATARMSILHVSIQHSSANPETPEQANQGSDSANKIYAISSVDGNVIYHVSNAESAKGVFPKRLKWRWKKETNLSERGTERVFAITSLKNQYDGRPSYVTKKNIIRDIELPRSCNRNMSVLVNPFSAGFPEDEFTVEDNQRGEFETQMECNISDYNKRMRSLRELDRFSDGNIEMDVLPRHSKITLEVTTSDSPPAETKFFNQLQHRLFGGTETGCEETLSAYEYFHRKSENSNSSVDNNITVVREVLDSLIDSVVRRCESESAETESKSGVGVHPYHSHIFLYCGVYDSSRTLYAFNTLKNILLTNSRLFLNCAATSGILNAPFSSDLLISLARHRKSVFGRSFHGDVTTLNEYISVYRSNMYLEILVSICLYFARSYYPNLGLLRLTADEIAGNRQVQLTSIEILMHIFTELIPIVHDKGKGFANYIDDVLLRYKVQKIILHCLMSSIHNIQQQLNGNSNEVKTFTEEIIDFNDPHVTKSNQKGDRLTEYSEALQIQLLKVLLALIILEKHIDVQKVDSSDLQCAKENSQSYNQDTRYVSDTLIPLQPIFLEAVSSALKLKGPMRLLHYNWTELVTSSLPYLGSALPQIVSITINQICSNIDELTVAYSASKCDSDDCLPADYAINQLEALTVLCHFCVLDSSQQVSPMPLASVIGLTHSGASGSNPGQIFNNLLDVFAPPNQEAHKEKSEHLDVLLSARRCVLGSMPRIISSLASLWQAVTEVDEDSDDVCIWGNCKVVRSQILTFLSPISFHHGPIFLSAIAVAWRERKDNDNNKLLPVASHRQQVLVNLVSSIRVMPIESLVQTVHLVVKQHPTVQGAPQDDSLEVSVLELFYIYMQSSTSSQLWESWSSLLGLLRDGLMLSPPALFLILAILNEWVQKCPSFQDKKDQRDLQDITSKLIEACGNVAGACLEQRTWLGRVFTPVKADLESPDETSTTKEKSSSNILQQHSVRAQLVLAQVLAPLLDITYGSQEKEKVAQLLTKLMENILPHLKNHSPENLQSFQACSQLLANLSGFQYTRKAWKRDVFDLLLSPSLFQMDFDCLSHWTTIIDNLMTNDMTTFRDLLSKVSGLQSGSYVLFSSKEQDYEQRAELLKRLAFVIFCSEVDQYHKYMPNIRERLTESLRLPQVVPSVQAQVFFCFRILLLRMSSHHITSLWPIIISEMVQVFTYIEQELCADSEEFGSHIKMMSALDSSWVVNTNNGLHAHSHPYWMQLTVAAVKLLDLAVLLPAQHLPQFQMYRWAFVSDPNAQSVQVEENDALSCHDFVPHVSRISRLMDKKYGEVAAISVKEDHLLLETSHVNTLQQLHPFFKALAQKPPSRIIDMEALEKSILSDFLEKMPSKV